MGHGKGDAAWGPRLSPPLPPPPRPLSVTGLPGPALTGQVELLNPAGAV